MQSLFIKMGLVLISLAGWVVYDRWSEWASPRTASVAAVTAKVKSSLPSEPPTNVTTKVYKWQDAQGHWQFSNAPPKTQVKVATQTYHSNENIIPRLTLEQIAVVTRKNKKTETSEVPASGVFGHLPAAVNSARDTQAATVQHDEQMQRALQQN